MIRLTLKRATLVTSWFHRVKLFQLLRKRRVFEARRAELEAKLADVLAAANARAEAINALGTVTIASKAGDEGKLFGSIGTRDIADAVTAAGVKVAKSEVRMPNGVLRTTGEHEVDFRFTAKCSLNWLLTL